MPFLLFFFNHTVASLGVRTVEVNASSVGDALIEAVRHHPFLVDCHVVAVVEKSASESVAHDLLATRGENRPTDPQ